MSLSMWFSMTISSEPSITVISRTSLLQLGAGDSILSLATSGPASTTVATTSPDCRARFSSLFRSRM